MTRYVKLLCMLLTVAVLLTGLKMIVVSAQSNESGSEHETVLTEIQDDSSENSSNTETPDN